MLSLLAQDEMKPAFLKALAAKEAGLPLERLDVGPREQLEKLHNYEPFAEWRKQFDQPEIIHGPMLGKVAAYSASFWIRTREAGKVTITLSDGSSGSTATTKESGLYRDCHDRGIKTGETLRLRNW